MLNLYPHLWKHINASTPKVMVRLLNIWYSGSVIQLIHRLVGYPLNLKKRLYWSVFKVWWAFHIIICRYPFLGTREVILCNISDPISNLHNFTLVLFTWIDIIWVYTSVSEHVWNNFRLIQFHFIISFFIWIGINNDHTWLPIS